MLRKEDLTLFSKYKKRIKHNVLDEGRTGGVWHMSLRRKLAFILIALSLIVSPTGSAPMLYADSAIHSISVSQPEIPATSKTPTPPTISSPVSSSNPVSAEPQVKQITREINVGLAGGQDVVDLGQGPVLFPLPKGFPPYIVEHDLYGGTERFGTLREGMTVKMTGLVSGVYTVGQIINVPNTGTTDEFKAYRTRPKVMLQTCITGTDRMIIVGLY
jgi:hypothetical protein